MQKGISIVDLAKKIEANRAMKHDLIVQASAAEMVVQGDGKTALRAGDTEYPIRELAHDQLGQYLKVPAPYYDRMRAEAPDLLASNINTWLKRSEDRRMVRTLDGDVRAWLSDKYARIENEEIAQAVLPVLLNTPGLDIFSSEVTDRRLYIQATTSRLTLDVKVGDAVQAGVIISNSEVGLGAVSVRPVIFRLVCLNGMVVPDSKFSARHVGRRIAESDDLNAMFSDEAKKADDRALLLKVRDVVTGSLDEAFFRKTVERLSDLTERKIEGDPAKAVEVLAQKIGANEGERGGILRALIEGGDTTAWGLTNAVTAQAHGGSYDRAVEFAQAGGALLNLPKAEWKEILEAA